MWLRSEGGSSSSSSVVCSLGVEGCGEGYVGILAEEGHKKGTRVIIVRQNPHALLNTKRAGGEMGRPGCPFTTSLIVPSGLEEQNMERMSPRRLNAWRACPRAVRAATTSSNES